MEKFFNQVKGALKIGSDKTTTFDVTFHEAKLGMTLSAGPDGQAVVTTVLPGGPAAKGGVACNDVIATVDGTNAPMYNEVVTVVGVLGRPLVIGFYREGKKQSIGEERAGVNTESKKPLSALQRAQEAARRKIEERQTQKPHQAPPMTEEEKEERRKAALKAAEARTKNWDKRLQKGRQATQAKAPGEGGENKFTASTNAETKRIVELAKQQEAATAQRMGYNPYEARLMGHTAARAAVQGAGGGEGGIPLANQSQSSPVPLAAEEPPASVIDREAVGGRGEGREEVEEEWIGQEAAMAEGIAAEVEEALGGVLAQEHTVALVAIQTIRKMLQNMATKSGEDKFKRIRLGNPNFQGKVGSVDGGIEVSESA
ncbi:unnamed protein product, partial [Choristocarpus tenellus]